MSPLAKLRDLSPRDLERSVRLPDPHRHLLSDGPTSATLLARLEEAALLAEAARLLGYALPEREAVWWACMCIALAGPLASLPAEQHAALSAAEAWVRTPGDETRLGAHRASVQAGYRTPAALAAQAAFASPLPVSWPLRTGRKVEQAIELAAAQGGAEHQADRLRRFIASGRDIASGGSGRLAGATS